jgi:predicted transcriptional regulator
MTETTVASKQQKPITGSSLATVRIHNRVKRRLPRAARKLGLTKNGLMAKAIENLVDSALAPTPPSGAAIAAAAERANEAVMVGGAN